MERVRQVVGSQGLQIPLIVMQQYGLVPGTGVVLELGQDGIRIVPVAHSQAEIENRALRYILANLGDAATIKAEQANGEWQVAVLGAGTDELLGQLVFSSSGAMLFERSTSAEELRRRTQAHTEHR